MRLRGISSRELMRMWFYVACLGLLVFSLGSADPAVRFNDLGHKMICQCGCNQVLLECNHYGCPVSPQMRAELQAGLDRGDSDDLVIQSFVQKYGAVVLAAPIRGGFDNVAWIVPIAAFLLATLGVALVIQRWRRPLTAEIPTPDASTGHPDSVLERIRRETDI
jgi:cytochrome c-type biogenesis protein CcmH/NrfF